MRRLSPVLAIAATAILTVGASAAPRLHSFGTGEVTFGAHSITLANDPGEYSGVYLKSKSQSGRKLANGVPVRLEWPDGASETVSAVDVDAETGALLVGELGGGGKQRSVLVGEIRHLRLGGIV